MNNDTNDSYRLRPLDGLYIELCGWTDPTVVMTGNFTVNADGTIIMPMLAGVMHAAGRTYAELARELEAAYGPDGSKKSWIDPAVFIVGPSRDEVRAAPWAIVQGEVRNPGRRIPVHEFVRLFIALMKSGGFTEFSAVDRVKIIRGGKELSYDLSHRVTAEMNPLLEDGDVIIVSRR